MYMSRLWQVGFFVICEIGALKTCKMEAFEIRAFVVRYLTDGDEDERSKENLYEKRITGSSGNFALAGGYLSPTRRRWSRRDYQTIFPFVSVLARFHIGCFKCGCTCVPRLDSAMWYSFGNVIAVAAYAQWYHRVAIRSVFYGTVLYFENLFLVP